MQERKKKHLPLCVVFDSASATALDLFPLDSKLSSSWLEFVSIRSCLIRFVSSSKSHPNGLELDALRFVGVNSSSVRI